MAFYCTISNIIFIYDSYKMKTIKRNRPWFCKCKDPDTNKRCNRLLKEIDDGYIELYGMCRDCFYKYNQHLLETKNEVETNST